MVFRLILKACAVFFNANCNEPVFSPLNPEKNLTLICLVVFEKNAKTA